MRGVFWFVPIAAVKGGIVQLAALDDEALQGGAPGINGRLIVITKAGLGIEPAAVQNIAVFDDDVVPASYDDRADWARARICLGAGTFERQTANDDVGGVNRNAVVVLVTHVDRCATAIVEAVGLGRA